MNKTTDTGTGSTSPSSLDACIQALIEVSGIVFIAIGSFMINPTTGYICTGGTLIVAAVVRRLIN